MKILKIKKDKVQVELTKNEIVGIHMGVCYDDSREWRDKEKDTFENLLEQICK